MKIKEIAYLWIYSMKIKEFVYLWIYSVYLDIHDWPKVTVYLRIYGDILLAYF
jgi:hypothetical protein